MGDAASGDKTGELVLSEEVDVSGGIDVGDDLSSGVTFANGFDFEGDFIRPVAGLDEVIDLGGGQIDGDFGAPNLKLDSFCRDIGFAGDGGFALFGGDAGGLRRFGGGTGGFALSTGGTGGRLSAARS